MSQHMPEELNSYWRQESSEPVLNFVKNMTVVMGTVCTSQEHVRKEYGLFQMFVSLRCRSSKHFLEHLLLCSSQRPVPRWDTLNYLGVSHMAVKR
eukprot:scaffold246_cov414-Prasinococcus_capsulatus_cf.AAC.8